MTAFPHTVGPTRSAARTARRVGVTAWTACAASALLGLAANPLVLEGGLFRAGERLASPRWTAGLWVLSIGALAGAAAVPPIARTLGRRRTKFAACSVLAGGAAGVLAGEAVCRWVLDLAQVVAVESDLWWEHAWRRSHAAQGPQSAGGTDRLNAEYVLDAYDELLGWSPRPGARQEGVTINAQGFRDVRDPAPSPAPGEVRIAAVGDSFTFGEGVADGQTYCAVLEQLLPGTTVLNFGVHGYGLDQQYLRLRRDALRFGPRLVVLGLFLPDIERNALAFRDYAKPRFELRDGGLALTNVPVPRPEEVLARPMVAARLPRSYLASLIARHVGPIWNDTRWGRPPGLDVTPALLDAALDEARRGGAQLLLVLIPPGWGSMASEERVCLRWAGQRNVPVVNVAESVRGLSATERRGLYHESGDGHFSPAGHALVADAIARAIRAGRLLDPPEGANP